MSVPDAEFFRLVRAASTLEVMMELRRFAASDSIFPVTSGGICMNSGPLLLNKSYVSKKIAAFSIGSMIGSPVSDYITV